MTSIADMFAAQLEDLKRRSDESDRKMAEHLASCRRHLQELERINDAIDSALI